MGGLANGAVDTQRRADEAVRWLNDAYASSRLELAIRIGRYLVDTVMGGDLSTGKTHPSFRAIAAHPELRLSHSYLWYAVQIAEQADQLPPSVSMALSVSQHRRLTAVRSPALKRELAERALAERWTIQRLEAEIGRLAAPSNAGRRPTPPLARLADEVARALEKAEAAEEPIRSLSSYERADLADRLEQQISRLTQLRRCLGF